MTNEYGNQMDPESERRLIEETHAPKKLREYHPHAVFVPIESRNGYFGTSDGDRYQRDPATGAIRRLGGAKTNGKAARRARADARKKVRRRGGDGASGAGPETPTGTEG